MWLISRSFARYWFSHFSSSFSNALTGFLLPLIAVSVLGASAFEMGILVAIQETPVIVFSLAIGLWLDRVDLRRVLIVSLLTQTVVVSVMGMLLFSTWRSMMLLYVTAALLGSVKLIIDLAGTTYLPALVRRDQLVGANSRLQISLAAERVLGPALGGAIAKLTPFLGFVFAAAGHLLGAVLLITLPQIAPRSKALRISWHADIKSGMRLLFENPMLRPVILSSCLGSLAVGMFYALLVFTLVQKLGLDAVEAGVMVAVVGASTLVVSVFVPRLAHLVGTGWAMIYGVLASASGFALFALAVHIANLFFAAAGLLLLGAGTALFSITQISIRQAVTPSEFLGRVNASRRFVVFAFLPIGSLVGGAIAEFQSVVLSVLMASLIMFVSALPLLVSPVKQFRLASD